MMHLAHRQASTGCLLPLAQPQLELAEPETVRMGGLVLQPQQLARYVLMAPQFLVNRGPVRHAPLRHQRRRKQRRLQRRF
jgi:hypothetical protein